MANDRSVFGDIDRRIRGGFEMVNLAIRDRIFLHVFVQNLPFFAIFLATGNSRNRLSQPVPMQPLTYNLFHVSFDVMYSIQ